MQIPLVVYCLEKNVKKQSEYVLYGSSFLNYFDLQLIESLDAEIVYRKVSCTKLCAFTG